MLFFVIYVHTPRVSLAREKESSVFAFDIRVLDAPAGRWPPY